jgi:hypothetical protein
MSHQKRAYRHAAHLILAGRYGRACRAVARAIHTSPLPLKDKDARRKWALAQ